MSSPCGLVDSGDSVDPIAGTGTLASGPVLWIGEPAAVEGETTAADASLETELIAQGRVVPHPVFPTAEGPAARRIESQADVEAVIELLRLNYDRAVALHGLPTVVTDEPRA